MRVGRALTGGRPRSDAAAVTEHVRAGAGDTGTKLLSEEEIHQLTFSFQKILMNSRGEVGNMTKACPPEVTVQWGVSCIDRSC